MNGYTDWHLDIYIKTVGIVPLPSTIGPWNYADDSHRPSWATDVLWCEYQQFLRGLGTVGDFWRGILRPTDYDIHGQYGRWRYSHVPGTVSGERNFDNWTSMIEQFIDVGL